MSSCESGAYASEGPIHGIEELAKLDKIIEGLQRFHIRLCDSVIQRKARKRRMKRLQGSVQRPKFRGRLSPKHFEQCQESIQ